MIMSDSRVARVQRIINDLTFVNNNESTSGSARLHGTAPRPRAIGAPRSRPEDAAAYPGDARKEFACRSLLIPQLEPRDCERVRQRGIVNPCRSLLIPRVHFGAAGTAVVFGLAAGRLPLAGGVGSSCA